jgi:16S rRNA (guanine1516-N2)-methyltransferase
LQSNNTTPLIVFCPSSSGPLFEEAIKLSKLLNLQFRSHPEPGSGYSLNVTDTHLELRENTPSGKNTRRPLIVDFISGKNGYRRLHNSTIHQPLARAVGVKPGFRPSVLDGTAGFGGDGFVLACLGCKVTLVERSPVLGALLGDGLRRGLQDEKIGKIIQERIALVIADTREILKTLSPKPFSIYLDPMYPKRQKSALNKMEMRVLRTLVGDDQDGSSLLQCALDFAANRVVVKRPKEAPLLAGLSPSHQIMMKSSRFDVYLTRS